MRFVYNILFLIGFGLSAPFYFLKMWRRGNWTAGFAQRFGIYDGKIKQALTNRHVIWFHAVSVGEVNVCAQLIQALEPRVPNLKIVVSTTTSTGMAELKKRLPTDVTKIYYPVDRRKFVRRALSTIAPEAIVLVEAEIWPNFLWRAIDKEIPLLLVNARLSDKSFRGYKRFQFLFRPIFNRFCGVGAQNKSDAKKLIELGFCPETVRTLGNLKFDAVKVDSAKALDISALLKQLGVNENARVLVAGSTHSGEEKILAGIFLRLKKRFPDLFFILVPRHVE
ncbi:MAG: 3-deoxy-D-manno-octulosonic acid transferase, partial [Verrucomicrobiales bacterium]|nr:3-deoxy-D-manno-octulosonic acid transferase [Verrucomicrobiales bacterium]